MVQFSYFQVNLFHSLEDLLCSKNSVHFGYTSFDFKEAISKKRQCEKFYGDIFWEIGKILLSSNFSCMMKA